MAAPVTASPPANTPSRLVRPAAPSGDDAAPPVGLEAGRGGAQQGVGAGADGHDPWCRLPAQNCCPPFPPGGGGTLVRLAQLHLHTRGPLHSHFSLPSTRTGFASRRNTTPSSWACSTSSLRAGSSLMPRRYTMYTVSAPNRFGAAGGVHGDVAAAHHRHAAAFLDGVALPGW